jgi:hypothetical protein
MLLGQAIADRSDNCAKYITALCGQNAAFFLLLKQVMTTPAAERKIAT